MRNATRIASIDILRGLVMILMALDHTRDFLHETAMTADPLDPATTTVPLFFTRWITHFCAPVFIFLSGISAYLSGQYKTTKQASDFLIRRGIWLVLAEITIITFGITFDPFFRFVIWQVIWAIGWSMILLGLLVRTSYKAILITGLILLIGHNFLKYLPLPTEGVAGALWKVLFTSRSAVLQLTSGHFAAVLYTILPWTSVMLLGYCAGVWYKKDFSTRKRKKLLRITGSILIIVFVCLRALNDFGDLTPWQNYQSPVKNFLSFLNTTKYPPSLQYMAMTLGPSILFLSFTEGVKTSWSRFATVYGKVPFFYYVVHFYLIHFLTVIVFFATGHTTEQIADTGTPFLFRPANFGYGLPVLYITWLVIVIILYLPCRWFHRYKMSHSQWWLKYI
ncbi:MAG: DUF1624 domain-containing protein [Chitinophagaceae bacterium]|nr:DUF1624 domain-containing protein [Chitinophagaceae bacterium]MBX3257675.1 DUF1624 domain-containing protein [Chitinophagaceae bacterium]